MEAICSYLVHAPFRSTLIATFATVSSRPNRETGQVPVLRPSMSYAPGMRRSVTEHIDADPDAVWSLLSDVTQIGRFSPETFEAQWLDGAAGPAIGARFRGHVRRNEKGPVYWTECTVVGCEPCREFAFTVRSRPFGLPIAPPSTVQVTWSYRLTRNNAGGTDVTESFELTNTLPMRMYWAALEWARGPRLERDMGRTLRAIKAVVERTAQ